VKGLGEGSLAKNSGEGSLAKNSGAIGGKPKRINNNFNPSNDNLFGGNDKKSTDPF